MKYRCKVQRCSNCFRCISVFPSHEETRNCILFSTFSYQTQIWVISKKSIKKIFSRNSWKLFPLYSVERNQCNYFHHTKLSYPQISVYWPILSLRIWNDDIVKEYVMQTVPRKHFSKISKKCFFITFNS